MINLIILFLMSVLAGGVVSWVNVRFGAKTERAKIVAWLRNQDGHGYDDMRANLIEAGEHLK